MPEPDLIGLFIQPLHQLGLRYLVSGSVAAMLYGEPRVTLDIDVIVFLRPEDALRMAQAFSAPEFYVPPVEIIISEMTRESRGHFNVIHIRSGLKADFYVANRDELHAWAFRRLRHFSVLEVPVALAPPEYVILRKLEYFREGGSEKHLRDIRAMLAISGDLLDRPALDDWIERLRVETEWRRVMD